MANLRIALAQINPTVGDFHGNEQSILSYMARARDLGADVVAFPELAVPGYPPEDLLLQPSFVTANLACLKRIAQATTGITAVVGFVDQADDLYNAAAILHQGEIAAVCHKNFLPNYAVFDEERYFRAGDRALVMRLGEAVVGVNICEDIWHPSGPTEWQALAGAQLVINISASPFHRGKRLARERMLATRAADSVVYIAFCNLVGGQDELVFDGGSVVMDGQGELVTRGQQFAEDLVVADLDLRTPFRQRLHDPRRRQDRSRLNAGSVDWATLAATATTTERPARWAKVSDRAPEPGWASPGWAKVSDRAPDPGWANPGWAKVSDRAPAASLEPVAEVYSALMLGTRDYVRKNGFRDVVIGLSGGIDSALTAAIAADALGADHVAAVFMPSRYSSEESRQDAEQVAQNLGIRYLSVPIDGTFQSYLHMLAQPFAGRERDVTEENLQARIRGNILMALSNKLGWLVLTTGNKSEMSVGYATLYGDMAGGFAVIKDVPKMLVYDLAEYRNAQPGQPVIPQCVLDKAPTAELRPNQKDEDSLPPYRILDPILRAYVEQDRSLEEIVAMGFEPATVSDVLRMVDRAEYKRRQAPPGVRITERAFGKDRRLPISNRFRHAQSQ